MTFLEGLALLSTVVGALLFMWGVLRLFFRWLTSNYDIWRR